MTTATIPNLGTAWPWPTIHGPRGAGSPGWFETTEAVYDNQLGVLPPIYFRGGFMVSEPADHDGRGVPIYAAFVKVGPRYFVREVPEDRAVRAAAELHTALGLAPLPPIVKETGPEWAYGIRRLDRLRGHELLPAVVLAALPPLYSQDGKGLDAVAHLRLFAGGSAVWYLTELDPATGEAFGWADAYGDSGELGYCSLPEIGGSGAPMNGIVERDCHWTARPLSACPEVKRQSR